jgi:putative ABC transport system ATP-binding protein
MRVGFCRPFSFSCCEQRFRLILNATIIPDPDAAQSARAGAPPPGARAPLLRVRVPTFSYAATRTGNTSSQTVVGLPEITLHPGEIVVLSGRSGSGKSTLLHLITGVLALPQTLGSISIGGKELAALSQTERDSLRPYAVGWMPQRVHLISALSVLDNVMLPITLGAAARSSATSTLTDKHVMRQRAIALLDAAQISQFANTLPSSLSVGQASRACAARALVANPQLLCADEPSAALDRDSANAMAAMIANYVQAGGAAVIASHDQAFIDALRALTESVKTIALDAQ